MSNVCHRGLDSDKKIGTSSMLDIGREGVSQLKIHDHKNHMHLLRKSDFTN